MYSLIFAGGALADVSTRYEKQQCYKKPSTASSNPDASATMLAHELSNVVLPQSNEASDQYACGNMSRPVLELNLVNGG